MKITDIKIGNRFRQDMGDIQTLAASIKEIGLLQPVVINQDNELIAGQRRLEACRLLGWSEIPATIVNLDDIVRGEFHENAVRKDFTVSERVAILEEIESKRIGRKIAKGDNLAPFQYQHRGEKSRKIVAQFTGVSPAQLQKEKRIVDAARKYPDEFTGLLKKVDDRKISVDKAYNQVDDHERRKIFINEAPKLELPDNIQLVQADCREYCKKLPESSINLIFTDPPYDEASLPLYRDLAIIADRVLKEGASLVIYVGHYAIPQIFKYIEGSSPNLTYWHILNVIHSGRPARMFQRQVVVGWKPLLWFVKGQKLRTPDFIRDTIVSTQPGKVLHEWEQSAAEAQHVIARLTFEGSNEIVLDPFMGSGTTGIAAKKLGRSFLGIEINSERFKVAKANLANCTNISQGHRGKPPSHFTPTIIS